MNTVEEIKARARINLDRARGLVLKLLLDRGEVYSADVWRAWKDSGWDAHSPPRRMIQWLLMGVLRPLEEEGVLASELRMPYSHGGGIARRYFRLTEAGRSEAERVAGR